MNKLATFALITATALLSSACAETVAGDYQSREKLSNSKRNQLTLDEDGGGELLMFVRLVEGEKLKKIKYSVDWGVEGEAGDGTEINAKLVCKKFCVEGLKLKFSMTCLQDDLGLLDCKAKNRFTKYGYLEFEPIVAE